MKKPNKLVALCVNISGGCEYVATVKNITETEYAELFYQQRQHDLDRQRKEQELKDRLDELVDRCEKLEKDIKVLKGEEDEIVEIVEEEQGENDYEESIED